MERIPIPTIHGPQIPSDEDCEYMDYLDNLYDAPDYGLLMFKGDPGAFAMGRDEYLAEKEHDEQSLL